MSGIEHVYQSLVEPIISCFNQNAYVIDMLLVCFIEIQG